MKRVGIWLALLGLSFFQGCCNPPPRTVVVASARPDVDAAATGDVRLSCPVPNDAGACGIWAARSRRRPPRRSAFGRAAAAAAIDHGAAGAIVVEPDRGGLAGGRGERTAPANPSIRLYARR